MAKKSRVLVVGDLHCPVMHKDYVPFLRDTYKRYRLDKVVMIGDIVDLHGMSYHESDPDLPSAAGELELARRQVASVYKAFPKAEVMTGNHDALPERKARSAGIPAELIRQPSQFLDVPGWRWHPRMETVIIDGVMYAHGDRGKQGDYAAMKNAICEGMNYVQGHLHSQAGVWYHACQSRLIFGMNVGCGVDRHSAAMKYGKGYSKKPIVGCGVVLSGVFPFYVPMEL